MGKKLRNRQIIAESDLQTQNTDPVYPLVAKLSKSSLKKSICKKFAAKQKRQTPKHEKFIGNVQNGSISTIIDETKFQCPICLELMVRPTLMNCGHMYCYRCLESNFAHNSSCSLCRQQQNPDHFIHSALAQNLINEILVPRSNELFKYLCRTTDTLEWSTRREVKNPRAGLIVDFQDAFKVWRRAIILSVFVGKEDKLMVKMKTFFKGTELIETIEATSKRLAPLNFFTRSKYLEDFTPALPQYDLYEKELELLEYRNCENQEDLFPLRRNEQQSFLQFQQYQRQQLSQNLQDQALALFNWEMNGVQLLF